VSRDYPTPDGWADGKAPGTSPGRKGWLKRQWTRLRTALWFSGSGDPRLPEQGPLVMTELLNVDEPADEFTIETPAMGEAFNFLIRVRCTWHIQAVAKDAEKEEKTEEIRKFIEKSRPIMRYRIEEHVRPIARKYPPYLAAEAEAELEGNLIDCLKDGDVRVEVHTRVDVSDPVREELQKVWRQPLIAEGALKNAHVAMLAALQKSWQGLLVQGLEGVGAMKEAEHSWLAPYALALAETPEHAAKYLEDVLETRVRHAEQLLAGLGMLAVDDRAEAIEFAFHSESALRRLLMYLDLPLPEELAASSRNGASSNGTGGGSHSGGTHA
jgi:hypothetical protein